MDMLTTDKVVALEKGAQISGIVGVVRRVNPPKDNAMQVSVQRVAVGEGDNEIVISIESPQDCGGIMTSQMVGKKLYFWPEADDKGKIKGLRRGGSTPSTTDARRFCHWINLSYPAKWGTQDKSKDPGMSQADAPEDSFESSAPLKSYTDKLSDELFGEEKKDAPKEPPPPDFVARAFAQKQSAPPTDIPPALAILALQHRQCLEAALDTAKTYEKQCGKVTGGGFSDQSVVLMAGVLFYHAKLNNVWKA